LLYHATFHELFEAEREAPEFAMLLQKMRVVTAEGESELTEEQWEAASKCTSLCNAYTRLINAQISMSRLLLRGCKALRTCGGRICSHSRKYAVKQRVILLLRLIRSKLVEVAVAIGEVSAGS
jgi:hypothetical protein